MCGHSASLEVSGGREGEGKELLVEGRRERREGREEELWVEGGRERREGREEELWIERGRGGGGED